MPKVLNVTEAEIKYVPHVPYTQTWNPVHHREVISAVERACHKAHLEPVDKTYELSGDGKEMFASWTMESDNTSQQTDAIAIGFRNSMKKTFSVGVVGGNKICVCANMCFFGEFIEHRRHTCGLTEDSLREWAVNAVTAATLEANVWRQWLDVIHEVDVSADGRKQLVYDAIDRKILSPSQWKSFHESYEHELKDNRIGDQENLMQFHGAVTRTLRANSIAVQQQRTRKLNSLCMDYVSWDKSLEVM